MQSDTLFATFFSLISARYAS